MKIIKAKDILNANKLLLAGIYPSVNKFSALLNKNRRINLLYGETYDKYDLTIDSLKYYFFLSLLHSSLEASGYSVASQVIVGDTASVLNESVDHKEILFKKGSERINKIKEINNIYRLKFQPVLMSDLFKTQNYIANRRTVEKFFCSSDSLQNLAKNTVLVNRLKQEQKMGYKYTKDEIALIIDADIKIGPPREIFYDKIAYKIKTKLQKGIFCGLYLKPTYPLGLGADYFLSHAEIEKYGLTPYKAGSNKLEKQRVVLGKTSLKDLQNLINSSFLPNQPNLPNPVMDLFYISLMAKRLLAEEKEFNLEEEGVPYRAEELKNLTYEYVKKYVYQPLGL